MYTSFIVYHTFIKCLFRRLATPLPPPPSSSWRVLGPGGKGPGACPGPGYTAVYPGPGPGRGGATPGPAGAWTPPGHGGVTAGPAGGWSPGRGGVIPSS